MTQVIIDADLRIEMGILPLVGLKPIWVGSTEEDGEELRVRRFESAEEYRRDFGFRRSVWGDESQDDWNREEEAAYDRSR